jgi:hypothetical protein
MNGEGSFLSYNQFRVFHEQFGLICPLRNNTGSFQMRFSLLLPVIRFSIMGMALIFLGLLCGLLMSMIAFFTMRMTFVTGPSAPYHYQRCTKYD